MSSLADSHTSSNSLQICLRAPFRRDADYLGHFFSEELLAEVHLLNEDSLEAVRDGSILVCTQEALSINFLTLLKSFLHSQPSWSQLPVLMILDSEFTGSEFAIGLRAELARSVMLILERPAKKIELWSATRSLLIARRRQLDLRDQIETQAELRRELNHRLKNTLATFMAIYRMSLRQSEDLNGFKQRFDGRANALVGVQEILRAEDPMRRTLRELCLRVLSPVVDSEFEQLVLQGPDLEIDPSAAFTLSLVLNELATNAMKYGSLTVPGGQVHVSWRVVDETETALEWREINGPAVVQPKTRNYGTRFIEASALQLGGVAAFDYDPAGLIFKFKIKSSRRT